MKKIKLLAGLVALSAFNMAYAATASAPMQVTATVDSKCNISAGNMGFGTIQLGGTSPTANSNVTVECTKDTAYSIAFNGGLNNLSGAYRLKHATLNQYLDYMLSAGGSPNQIIPNQTIQTGVGAGLGSSLATVIAIQGSINPNSNVSAGNYSDTITVTVTY